MMRLTSCCLLGVVSGCSNAVVEQDEADTGGATAPGTSNVSGPEAETGAATDATAPGPTTSGPQGTITADPSGATMEVLTGEAATGTTDATGGLDTTAGTSTGGDDSTSAAPFDGCGAAIDPGPQDRTLVIDGADRHYLVVVPPGYDPAVAYPLVFAWHGRGGSGKTARLSFQIEEASAGQAIFVYPDGLPQANMGDQSGWDLTPNGVDVQFFDAMLADLTATACVEQGRVFSAGHSFGGFMSNALGCYRGGVVRAIGVVAGGGPFALCSGQVATWLAHGTTDQVVDFAVGEASRDHWVGANGCDAQAEPVEPAPCAAYAGCDAGFPVHWCAHDEPDLMGHAWPAWAGAGIWAFFAGL